MKKTARQVLKRFVLLLCLAPSTLAHDARPVAVSLSEELEEVYRLDLAVPPSVEADNQPRIVWPENCAPLGEGTTAAQVMRCAGGLEGRELHLDYPLFNPSLSAFFRLTSLDGGVSTALLPPSGKGWQVPLAPTGGGVALQYFQLGIEHILGGPDHLLFVLGLLVIAGTGPRILLTVTGFTLAHSLTLSLSALGKLSLPIVPVEAAIALSILFLAVEISRGRKDSLSYRYPLLVSFGFGLLHGLGFASALGEIGLVPNELTVSLLFFNLGVEAGQIAFILALLALLWLLGKSLLRWVPAQVLQARAQLLAAYVIGVPSAYWLIERVAQFPS